MPKARPIQPHVGRDEIVEYTDQGPIKKPKPKHRPATAPADVRRFQYISRRCRKFIEKYYPKVFREIQSEADKKFPMRFLRRRWNTK